MTAPTASVLMLAYNHEPYIQQSIECVLNQITTFPFELIVGEDCSPDATRKVISRFVESHPGKVRMITADRNVGFLENLRRIEAASRGQYVAYCEGDDYWHSTEKLQQQVAFLESNPSYAMVHSDFRTYQISTGKMTEKTLGLDTELNDDDAFNEILSGRRIVFTLTACIRRSVLERALAESPECYDSRFRMGDTQRWLEVAHRGKVKYFPNIWATRQLIPESASQSNNAGRVLKFSISAKHVLDHYIEKYGCSPVAKSAAARRSALDVLKSACDALDYSISKTTMDECRREAISVGLLGRLYHYGARSKSHQRRIKPAIRTAFFLYKVKRKLTPAQKSRPVRA